MTRVTWAQLPAVPRAANGKVYRMDELTDGELRRYRIELEQALEGVSEESADHATLTTRLQAVITEQEAKVSRRRAAGQR